MIPKNVFDLFLEALVQGRKAECRGIVTGLLDKGVPALTLYVELFSRALQEVGCRWERGELTVATEHLATAQVEDLLGIVYARQHTIALLGDDIVGASLQDLLALLCGNSST